MKGIMFNTQYGLENAVLRGTKTRTWRAEIYQICKGWCLNLNNSNYTTYFGTIVKYLHELQNIYYLANKKELKKI